MSGVYQLKNATLALAVFDAIWPRILLGLQDEMQMWEDESHSLCDWMDMEYASRVGILNASWPGRFEVIGENPLFIMDGAHNEDAAKQLASTLQNCFTNQPLTYIIGVLADKEHKRMLEYMLPYAKNVYTITPNNARGLDGAALAKEVEEVSKELGLTNEVEYCEDISSALNKAIETGIQNQTPIIAFGSLSYLGGLKERYSQICESRK